MGDSVSILDALLITFVSMLVVFLILILISFLINRLKVLSIGKEVQEEKIVTKESEVEMIAETEISEELVAVIAATVAANLGLDIADVKIENIKKVAQTNNS